MQTTLKTQITLQGVGLHSGKIVTMTMKPADVDAGIVFVRSDLPAGKNEIPALFSHVADTRLCTVIANSHGASVGTIEHVMSALRGLNIDNAIIEIDAPEVPIMDGSAMPFVDAIQEAGTQTQDAPRKVIRVLREVSYEEDGKIARLSPSDLAVYSGVVNYGENVIGEQAFSVTLLNGNFVHDIAAARTFCFERDVEFMRANNLALGGSLENAVVVSDTGVLNDEGLRFADEFVRHKILDGIGDLALAGAPIIGEYFGYKLGHDMNAKLLKALFSDPANFAIEYEDASEDVHIPAAAKQQYAYV